VEFKSVIFDLDGTLLNTLDDLGACMNSILRFHGFPENPLGRYKKIIGGGMESFVINSFPPAGWNREDIPRYIKEFRDEYSRKWDIRTAPYPGIPELLNELSTRKIRMSILSNKPDDFTKVIVAKLLTGWNFECVLGEREGVPIKPDPVAALGIASRMSLAPGDFVFVGDSGVDMKTALAAEMFPAGALWGFRDENELRESGARKILSEPINLLDLF